MADEALKKEFNDRLMEIDEQLQLAAANTATLIGERIRIKRRLNAMEPPPITPTPEAADDTI